ncbi:MAG: bifunctional DNA-formamidopyrimidine glycosylase/DNA-(apurinic or apyrimidinic site) lyase [Phycisphaerae bacterium]
MPELPEVEEVRRSLEPHLLGRAIVAARLLRPDFLTTPPGLKSQSVLQAIVGRSFVGTHRHGKKLFCLLDDGQTLLFHLGMTGNLAACGPRTSTPANTATPELPPLLPHTHFVLSLSDHSEIRFRDPRRFGGIWYYPSLESALAKEVTGRMGPDALTLTVAHLQHWAPPTRSGRARRSAGARLKARLLAQKDVAGLGNIYVDEALWMSRLHPLQRVDRIRAPELKALVAAIRKVLNRSIQLRGTTLRDYRNAHDEAGAFLAMLQAYGRGGQPCRRCRTTLTEAQIAGRTTVFCSSCQQRHN